MDDVIDQAGVEVLGDEAGPDSLNTMLTRFSAADHRRMFRLHRDRLEVRVQLLDVACHTGDRPPGADTGNDGVDLLSAILPDLWAGG